MGWAYIHHGNSAWPVVAHEGGKLVAMLNTGTTGPRGDRCANRPCQLTACGVATWKGTSCPGWVHSGSTRSRVRIGYAPSA